jgi:hypothetical protein
VSTTAKARRARKPHPCADCDYRTGMHTQHMGIQPGDVYLILTDFRQSDAGYADTAGHPVQMAICEHHAYLAHRPLIETRKANPR